MQISRREFLRLAALGAGTLILGACSNNPALPGATVASQSPSPIATSPQQPASIAITPSASPRVVPSAPANNPDFTFGEILGRPTNTSVAVNVVPAKNMELYYEIGTEPGKYTAKTVSVAANAGAPTESVLEQLTPNARHFYRVRYRVNGAGDFLAGAEHSFVTQRAPRSTFTFDIQGDSHPERLGRQFDPELYTRTLRSVAADQPDFHICIGDDFGVETLRTLNTSTVTERYTLQRPFLGIVGHSSPIFHINGNHEQASQYNLNGTPNNVAVWAQLARNSYYAMPAPDNFYSGDTQRVEHIGLLRDYYAWTWGDALFVVIDPYWHSPVAVDTVLGGGQKQRDLWSITIGDAQYQWFKQTLEQSNARYKFVFTHHVLGTQRGGVEVSDEYEWGGRSKNGVYQFNQMRPGWELPIHQLMVKNGVSIYFQGHDHIFVRQERDGIVYQTLPEPAHPFYSWENEDAYKSGNKFPNSGHLRVNVSPDQVKVEYIRWYLPKDESSERKSGEVAYAYSVAGKK